MRALHDGQVVAVRSRKVESVEDGVRVGCERARTESAIGSAHAWERGKWDHTHQLARDGGRGNPRPALAARHARARAAADKERLVRLEHDLRVVWVDGDVFAGVGRRGGEGGGELARRRAALASRGRGRRRGALYARVREKNESVIVAFEQAQGKTARPNRRGAVPTHPFSGKRHARHNSSKSRP